MEAGSSPRVIVRPGDGLAARRGRACLFLARADDVSVPGLLEAWERGGDSPAADSLFAIVTARRPSPVTPFCALFVDGSTVHVAIHGQLQVVAVMAGSELLLQGRDPESRVEEAISGSVSAMAVGERRPELTDDPLLNLAEGVVRAGSLQLSWPAQARAEAGVSQAREQTVIGALPPSTDQANVAFEHRPTLAVTATGTAASEVEGAFCAAGHFNNPESAQCRVCGGPLGEETVRRPRPPLGRLVTQDGREFIVDGPMLIGRRPGQAQEVAQGAATAVEVPAGETGVSRLHAELVVDGWAVLVRDLASANGTYLLPAGITEWVRLEPEHPVEIVYGTVIAVGGFEIKYEKP